MSKGSNLMKLRKKQRGKKRAKTYPIEEWFGPVTHSLEDMGLVLAGISNTLERVTQQVVELCSTAQQKKMDSKMERG